MTQISSFPARWVDTLQLHRSDTYEGFFLSAVVSRAISVCLFPLTTLIDAITNAASAAGQKVYSLLPIGEENQAVYAQSAHKTAISAARHFAAFLATPSSIFVPDMITHHFIPLSQDAEGVIRPYGRLYSGQGEIHTPRTIREIQEIVQNARRTKRQIAITGAGFSQGKHILPAQDGHININLKKMKDTRVSVRRKTITVGAGATWAEVQKAANEHGLAVQTMQASNVFSVGGSLGINCHGWDIRAGTLGNTIRSLTIVDAKGEIQVLTREDELFRLIVGGIGMFGIIVSAEIELTDNVELERSGDVLRPVDYLSYFRNLQADESVDMHLAGLSLRPGHLFEEIVAENYRQTGGEARRAELREHPEDGSALEHVALQYARNRRWVRAAGWEAKKRDILTPKRATRNEHMDFPIQAMFNHSISQSDWLQEYFVPPHQLNLFIHKLKEVLEKNDVRLYNASIRYVPQDASSEFSYAKDGEKFAIVLCFGQSLAPDQIEKTEKWVQEITEYLKEHEGTYYLPYQQFATKEQFRACHPEWRIGAEMKRKYDPNNLFYSGFSDAYIDTYNRIDRTAGLLFVAGESLETREARPQQERGEQPQTSFYRTVFSDPYRREKFKEFLENVYQQVDIEPFFTLMDDILAHASTDEEIYTELSRRLHEAEGSSVKTALRTIGALRNQVRALGEQFDQIVPEGKSFHGYVELETPGRYTREIQKKRKITGEITVINHARSPKDYIEAGFPLPFHTYVPLENYRPLDPNKLENSSVELVSCFKGLHHVKPEELEDFVKSIHRVLKPGGTFILRDHNAADENVTALAHVVHSLVNAANKDSWKIENSEVRNFHDLPYWQSLLERNGFRLVSDGMVRPGDPTQNTLLRFEKVETDRDRQLAEQRAHLDQAEGYSGDPVGVSFQAAEWENVLAAKRYAEVVRHVPFYEFKFMEHLNQFWKVFGEAWKIEREKHSLFELAGSFYTYMILFVGINMTIEYSLKAAISAPMLWAFGKSDGRPLPIQMVIEDPTGRASDIDDRINVIERLGDSNLYRIELRRFDEMREFVERATAAGIRPVELAGAKTAQLRVFIPSDSPEVLQGIEGLRPLFQWDDVENDREKLAQVRVQVENLPEILAEFERRHIRLEFIHDL